MSALLDAVRPILGAPLTGAIGRAFHFMEVAEDEIARACAGKRGKLRERVHGSFRHLAPGPLIGLCDDVYRHHCREIIERVARAEDVRPATKAEVMALISQASLAAPPTHVAGALMLRIFNEVFPENPQPVDGHFAAVPRADVDELFAEMRKKGARHRGKP